ncbi:response regulator with CheY-like receiver domain and winged-helix DNA-binding domain [Cylindrospermum stagnale PCC 7417]|uniref:Response regulator with CheY-like receiver domain and winged-helix DNA-binding domain n=1 Tax=Cylindrospermum stagnale PCC 7417 TaxID=56107 RepID=K9WYW6_9NOST|nr:response regulator transcription factor [Cylindrospermum stagnale]AFZ25403.1 response regulator with CheY-like receiver domain and winged-helix DNA-binding domain [Cylindrospermum stagnale PCC 7417]
MPNILIVEDEPRIASFIQKGLRSQGFTTTIVTDGLYVLDVIQSSTFDLLILDLRLPGKDGFKVLEELRGQGEDIPVIILSARSDIHDKVAGLEGGADDYVTKPFRFEELLARVRLRLRSARPVRDAQEFTLQVGNVVLDLRTRQVKLGDRIIELPAREFAMAEMFCRHPGQVISREQLLDSVWGYDYNPGSNIVDVYVGYLRKKLGSKVIETVRGMGYRLRI